jgi:hypothetical protein
MQLITVIILHPYIRATFKFTGSHVVELVWRSSHCGA